MAIWSGKDVRIELVGLDTAAAREAFTLAATARGAIRGEDKLARFAELAERDGYVLTTRSDLMVDGKRRVVAELASKPKEEAAPTPED